MADERFFTRTGPYTLRQLAAIGGAALGAEADADRELHDVAPLESAGPHDLGFLDNPRYLRALADSRVGACVLRPGHADRAPPGMALLLSRQPYRSYALMAQAFYPTPPVQPEIHPTAVVDASAQIGPDCEVGPGAVIAALAEVGARCRIGANAVIGRAVRLGADCMIGAGTVVSHCLMGDRVILHPGVRVGQDGFGFAPDRERHVKVPQIGRVIIEDDVEIGANSTVDRGAGPDTVIGRGSQIDNLVHIGHNVRLGRGCILAGQVGISGSTQLGDYAVVGGQAGFAGHLRIGVGATIAAKSGVTKDVPEGETWGGFPAVPIREFRRQSALLLRAGRGKGSIDD
ncbi:MAG: UDP-3-O-(3-hydroxymyristoyl)glucosamine N-acyltransferase [Alphaproteobacteria bacterium]|nr:UDP-3-O-(3-hydroxymyristoyl)glucosamine N-acyltransferase [Alphaproteobacteria bacterium]